MNSLIVGGDSRLGMAMKTHSLKHGYSWNFTSRRNIHDNRWIHYDLLNTDPEIISSISDVECYIVLAGITDYHACERDPEKAFLTNVTSIIGLARNLVNCGKKVVFISTNTVLGQYDRSPNGPYQPILHYSRQKAEVEKELLSLNTNSNNVKVIRLTKHVSRDTSPFGQWITNLTINKHIEAFTDLYLSPITFSHSAEFIDKVIHHPWDNSPSILHLSGIKDINYYEFALALAARLKKCQSLVRGVTSADAGLKLLHSPIVTYLDMECTSKFIGYSPITLDQVLSDLL